MVMTFDDATNNQITFLPDGRVDPKTAVGIFEDFAAQHPGFPATQVLRPAKRVRRRRWNGEEDVRLARRARVRARQRRAGPPAAEHARRHRRATAARPRRPPAHRPPACLPGADDGAPTRRAPAPRVACGQRQVGRPVVPLCGRVPLRRGAGAVALLDQVEPRRDPADLPNARWKGARDFTWGMWLDTLERHPELRSSRRGSETIGFPRAREGDLAASYAARAKPY